MVQGYNNDTMAQSCSSRLELEPKRPLAFAASAVTNAGRRILETIFRHGSWTRSNAQRWYQYLSRPHHAVVALSE